MQRDYSHVNAGAGFLLTTNGGTSNNTGDTIRYCISDDDGQSSGESSIRIGSIRDFFNHAINRRSVGAG